MVLGVDITGEFLRIILTVKIDIQASILFFIRIKRNSNISNGWVLLPPTSKFCMVQ